MAPERDLSPPVFRNIPRRFFFSPLKSRIEGRRPLFIIPVFLRGKRVAVSARFFFAFLPGSCSVGCSDR